MRLANDPYDNDLLEAMHRAMGEACAELGISRADRKIRRRVASLIMALARTGETDAQRLKSHAVSRLRFRSGIS